MYGEGHDAPPLYAPFPGNVVGALPVGLQTHGDNDVPYWPVQSTWTYKEVWVHPVARWLWLMSDLAGPALIEGEADSPVEFISEEAAPNSIVKAKPAKGHFRVFLPEGKCLVRCHEAEQAQTFLPTGLYRLDLRPGRALAFGVSKTFSADGAVRIRLIARGEGLHRFNVRADNLTFVSAAKELNLKRGSFGELEWSGHINSLECPWVAVVVADENPASRKEFLGAAWE
jgi:hypothetical protein